MTNNTRVAFVLVSLLTIILLIGSVILQRIVFKAAESDSTVFISPTTFTAKPGDQFNLTIRSDFSIPAYLAGAGLTVTYDEQRLEFVEAQALSGFTSKKLVTEGGIVRWVVVPSPDYGVVGRYSGEIAIGQLRFTAKQIGTAEVRLDPSETIISAVDPEGTSALYNAVVSVQNSAGQISTEAIATPPNLAEPTTTNAPTFTGQKVVSEEVLAMPDEAIVLVRLRYIGNVRIDFGETETLGRSIETAVETANLAVALTDLAPDKRYFYRLRMLDEAGEVISSLPLKSFRTPLVGLGQPDIANTKLAVLSPVTADETQIFALAFDQTDGFLAGSTQFRVVEGEAVISDILSSQYGRVLVKPLIRSKQKVTVEALIGETVVSKASVIFDPSLQQQPPPETLRTAAIGLTSTVRTVLLALLGLIIVSALALFRWLRVR